MKYLLQSIILLSLFVCINKPYYFLYTKPKPYLKTINQQELNCLTATIYFEARSESAKAQSGVAQVVLNRLKHKRYPKTICKVISQSKQFSWYNKSPKIQKLIKGSISDLNHLDYLAYQRAKRIALKGLQAPSWVVPELKNSLYFLTKDYSTVWSSKMTRIAVVDGLEFY